MLLQAAQAMTTVQVLFLALFVLGCLGAVGTFAVAVGCFWRLSRLADVIADMAGTNRDFLRLASANNEDTRRALPRVERAAATVERVASDLPAQVEEVKAAVAGAGSPAPPPWLPGQPDPRVEDLGPEHRGKR